MDKDLAIAIAVGFLLAAAISVIAYIFLRKKLVAERKNIRGEADRVLAEANRGAEAKLREASIEAKEKVLAARAEFDKTIQVRRQDVAALEKRVVQKEENLDRKLAQQEHREDEFSRKERGLADAQKKVEETHARAEDLVEEQRLRLEQISGLTAVDARPEAIVIPAFEPLRREVARLALEKLIADGRIHPARIEEIVEKVRSELWEKIRQEGEATALEFAIPDLHPELIKLLGRLKYRTSYGQNVLQHSKEVSWLATNMAAELGADVEVAKRAGLLHDIGKAIDREMEGTHLELGREVLKKFGESGDVIHAMECHHGDYEPRSLEALLVNGADALSAARPGARREILETYVKRLEKLEHIADGFKGVQKAFAVQAGPELRIIVEATRLTDDEALWLSRDVAKKIESELQYPGQIKVTVIRETRAVEYAR